MDLQKATREFYADLRKLNFVDEASAIAWLESKFREHGRQYFEHYLPLVDTELKQLRNRAEKAEAVLRKLISEFDGYDSEGLEDARQIIAALDAGKGE